MVGWIPCSVSAKLKYGESVNDQLEIKISFLSSLLFFLEPVTKPVSLEIYSLSLEGRGPG